MRGKGVKIVTMALRFDSVPPLCLFMHVSSGFLPTQQAYREGVFGAL